MHRALQTIPTIAAHEWRDYLLRGQPAIVHLSGWRERWTFDALRARFGELPVLAEATQNVYVAERTTEHTTMATLIDAIVAGDPTARYKGDVVQRVPQIGYALADDRSPFDALLPQPLRRRTTLWLTPRGTTSSLHHDGDVDNLNVQVEGQKTFLLLPPSDRERLSCWGTAESPIDPFAPNLARFPQYASVNPLRATLRAGDALLVPRYWFHCVRTDAPSVNVSTHFGWHGEPSAFHALCGTPMVQRLLTAIASELRRRGHERTARLGRRAWLSCYRCCVSRIEPQPRNAQ